MKKRLLFVGILVTLLLVCFGCGKKENNKKNESTSKAQTDVKKDEIDYDKVSSYATANYFNEKTAKVIKVNYCSKGNIFEFKMDSKEGKELLKLIKERFVNFGEPVSKKVVLKNKVEDIKTDGRAIEVVFEKGYIMGVEAQKNTDYRGLPIEVDSWFFPLDCEEEEYFTYLPQSDYTFGKLGDSAELIKYLESINLK